MACFLALASLFSASALLAALPLLKNLTSPERSMSPMTPAATPKPTRSPYFSRKPLKSKLIFAIATILCLRSEHLFPWRAGSVSDRSSSSSGRSRSRLARALRSFRLRGRPRCGRGTRRARRRLALGRRLLFRPGRVALIERHETVNLHLHEVGILVFLDRLAGHHAAWEVRVAADRREESATAEASHPRARAHIPHVHATHPAQPWGRSAAGKARPAHGRPRSMSPPASPLPGGLPG